MRHVAAFSALLCVLLLAGCNGSSAPPKPKDLVKTDLEVGTGQTANKGDTVLVEYKGTLTDGTVFDETKEGGEPYSFPLGAGRVIKGWDLGIPGMKEGGRRKLYIPSELAYGPQAQDKIPANSDLIFEVHLLRVVKTEDQNSISVKVLKPGHGDGAKNGDKLTVDYSVKNLQGRELANTASSGDSASFTLGTHEAKPAFEEPLMGMKLGEVRELTVPPMFGIPIADPESANGWQIVTVTLIKLNGKS